MLFTNHSRVGKFQSGYDTPSKRAFGPPLGLDVFAEILGAVETPVLAIGGINLSNYREPLRRGAAGVAAISLFADVENLEQTVRSITSYMPTDENPTLDA